MLAVSLQDAAWDEVKGLSAEELAKPGVAKALLDRLRLRLNMDTPTALADDLDW